MGTGSSISLWNDPWIPSNRLRPAKKISHVTDTTLTVDELINPTSRTWNSQLIRLLVTPEDAQLVESIPLSRFKSGDKDGWFLHNQGGMVKSRYEVESHYPDSGRLAPAFGPNTKSLQTFSWKIKCPRKLRHFLWQIISGSLQVRAKLRHRGIKCDTHFVRCEVEEKTINNVMFVCPPAVQVWALSRVPTNLGWFPMPRLRQFHVTFTTDCSQLVKLVLEPE